ncbi:flavin reductase family protein [Pseudorhodoplanes sinuspersici]|uniref:Flavin reductase n=1 Tax=Pseudorhodoplanes sinuspersici TaxID=1235591 RepID=A0A1W6ZT74_9HYPH|nr:flavin reductase family protein [Pseudorhodoplanes sinuspersici]ARQ00560.1 flavin reductase [Pseudorhodoplanes sinuspersici]RKE72156.1 flavin reductase (NADH)/flavin reductase [Pseudorhodoplanes sinuspersici]
MTQAVKPDLADRFRETMRRTASGVAVLTTDGAAGRAGITVSTLCSLSMEPPSVVACVHRDNRALDTILANGVFAANVLADDQEIVAKTFAGMIPEMRHDRFASGRWQQLATTAPVLQNALAAFDCKTASTFDFGTHRILIGEVVEVDNRDGAPLLFADRNFRRLLAA